MWGVGVNIRGDRDSKGRVEDKDGYLDGCNDGGGSRRNVPCNAHMRAYVHITQTRAGPYTRPK